MAKGILHLSKKALYTVSLLEAKKQLVKRYYSKNSNITKT